MACMMIAVCSLYLASCGEVLRKLSSSFALQDSRYYRSIGGVKTSFNKCSSQLMTNALRLAIEPFDFEPCMSENNFDSNLLSGERWTGEKFQCCGSHCCPLAASVIFNSWVAALADKSDSNQRRLIRLFLVHGLSRVHCGGRCSAVCTWVLMPGVMGVAFTEVFVYSQLCYRRSCCSWYNSCCQRLRFSLLCCLVVGWWGTKLKPFKAKSSRSPGSAKTTTITFSREECSQTWHSNQRLLGVCGV
jgi:hypothetical protein